MTTADGWTMRVELSQEGRSIGASMPIAENMVENLSRARNWTLVSSHWTSADLTWLSGDDKHKPAPVSEPTEGRLTIYSIAYEKL